MIRAFRWVGVGAGIAAAVALVACALAWLYSESVIERHYPLLSMDVPVSDKPGIVAHGRHLATLMGCRDCHGTALAGKPMVLADGFEIHASNLTRSVRTLSDEEFARAMRDGLAPDGKSLWAMPSQDYTYISVADAAAIIGYVHSLPLAGAPTPPVRFTRRDRLAIVEGTLEPTAIHVQDATASLDLGPRYEGGRYIARTSCGQCHGVDLSGTPDRATPDLAVVGRYALRDFFALLREGRAPDTHSTPAMHALATSRFYEFKDYEVMALYDYLSARAQALPPAQSPAKTSH